MRIGWSVAACLAAAVSGTGAAAQTQPGQYGGGFIEFLMTGRAPGLPRHPAVDGYGGLAPRAAPEPRTRFTALPQAQPSVEETAVARAPDPRFARQVVPYGGPGRPGGIVIDTGAKHLYLIQPGGQAIRYGIGVGRPGFLWTGVKSITAKREWPDWTPPAEMLQRRPDLPLRMAGGPENPLGSRALYLYQGGKDTLFRIHGTNEPHTIGRAMSSGCIRMVNFDVQELYDRVPMGARVVVR